MDDLRVLSLNVRVDTDGDGDDAWPNRREHLVSLLRYHEPDVIGLQEPLAHQYEYVTDNLEGYEWVGQSRQITDGDGEYTPVGFRTDRFDGIDTGTFWLSETPDEAGSVGWDARHPRIATWVRLDDGGDRPLLVCNTHLDHEGEQARRRGAGIIVDRLGDLLDDDLPVVCGDLNSVAGSPAHDRLDGATVGDHRLASAFRVADRHHGPGTTRTNFHDLLPDEKIDHVFVSDECRVAHHAIPTDRTEHRYPSDHLPVVVDVSW